MVMDAVEEGRGEKTGYGERADEGEKSGDRLLLCMDATDRMLGFQLALESSQLVPRKWRMR